jgi:hypothetical protein
LAWLGVGGWFGFVLGKLASWQVGKSGTFANVHSLKYVRENTHLTGF